VKKLRVDAQYSQIYGLIWVRVPSGLALCIAKLNRKIFPCGARLRIKAHTSVTMITDNMLISDKVDGIHLTAILVFFRRETVEKTGANPRGNVVRADLPP
jgi:hypothetical protein